MSVISLLSVVGISFVVARPFLVFIFRQVRVASIPSLLRKAQDWRVSPGTDENLQETCNFKRREAP